MRATFRGVAVLIVLGLAGAQAPAQVAKKDAPAGPSGGYRTLTGKISEMDPGGRSVTVHIGNGGGKAAAKGQSWILQLGRQTLILRAGRNGQYSMIEPAELKKGDTVQSVVDLGADPADHSHRAWWVVVYPPGTSPPSR